MYAAGALASAFLGAFLTTPITTRVARRFGILDRPSGAPDGHKQHDDAVPYLGGVAIFLGLGLGASILLLPGSGSDTSVQRLGAVLLFAAGLGIVGLLDDIRSLPRSARLAVQVVAGVGAWAADFRVQTAASDGVDLAITVVWFVGITNAFNLLDNMDGLSAGLAGVGALSFAVIGAAGQLHEVTIVASALAGAAFGFLAHNRHPAKAFMGDAGSLLLGFTLALVGIKLRFDNLIRVTFFVPVVVLGIPIFDTTLVMLSRWRNHKPLFLGGRDHISHRLVAIGLPVRTAVGLLYFSGLCLGWLGFTISRSNVQVGWMLLGFVVALGAFFGMLLWQIPTYDAAAVPDALDAVPDDISARPRTRRLSSM